MLSPTQLRAETGFRVHEVEAGTRWTFNEIVRQPRQHLFEDIITPYAGVFTPLHLGAPTTVGERIWGRVPI